MKIEIDGQEYLPAIHIEELPTHTATFSTNYGMQFYEAKLVLLSDLQSIVPTRPCDCEARDLDAELADLEKPCVWTWYPKFSCYETSCGEGLGPGSSIGVKKAFTFCPYCGHRLAALADTEPEEGGE